MATLPLGSDPFNSMRILTITPVKPSVAATMVSVRFKDNTGPYRGGEVAAFVPEDATALIAAGLAVAV